MALAVGYPVPHQTSENPHERADGNQAYRYIGQVTPVKHLKFRRDVQMQHREGKKEKESLDDGCAGNSLKQGFGAF